MPGLLLGLLLIVVGGILAAEVGALGTTLVLAGLVVVVVTLYVLHAHRPVAAPTDPDEPIAPQEPGSIGPPS